MAERSEAALAAVAEHLAKNPDAGTSEFQEVAAQVAPSVADLGLRSFNARYVVPLKRKAKTTRKTRKKAQKKKSTGGKPRGGGRRAKAAPAAAASDDGMRRLVLERDRQVMAAASDPKKAYEVAAGLDEFIAKLRAAAG